MKQQLKSQNGKMGFFLIFLLIVNKSEYKEGTVETDRNITHTYFQLKVNYDIHFWIKVISNGLN